MKYLLMYNPVSGRSNFKKKIKQIKRFFDKRNLELDIYESKKAGDLEKQAWHHAKEYDVFLVAGGDGTISEVVNGMMKSEIRPSLAILPSGTANDIAAILGVPRWLWLALRMYMKQEPVLMDINQMNDRYFVYTAASGVLSRISYDVSRRKIKKYGYLAYVFEAMRDFVKEYNYPVRIECDGKILETDCMMILGLSSNRVGGMRLINFSKSKLNDGLFEIRVFTSRRRFRRFRLASSFIRGGKKLREDFHLVGSHFKIETDDNILWNADGEAAEKGNIEIKTIEKALSVYVSAKRKRKQF
jgi:diacylglycerol kinase (ATP)